MRAARTISTGIRPPRITASWNEIRITFLDRLETGGFDDGRALQEALVLTALAVWYARSPERGPQDLLAGTWLVPV